MNLPIKSKGFTLIEILIALVFLSFSLLAIAGLMAMTTKNNSFGGHLTEAATFAQDRLEELRVIPYANLASGTDIKTSAGINYTRVLTVVPNATDTLRTVTITINWNDGIPHSVSIFTVVKNPSSGV